MASSRRGIRFVMAATASILVAVSLAPSSVAAQTPSAAAQKWNPPQTPDGQPDIQGYWIAVGPTAAPTFPIYTLEGGEMYDERQTSVFGGGNALRGAGGEVMTPQSVVVDPPSGRIPYQPWAAAKRKDNFENHTHPTKPEHIDGRARCHLPGVPRTTYSGESQIVQNRGYVVLVNAFGHSPRIIPLDGRPHVGEKIRLWQGDSRGRWEGNSLVVETTNMNAKWLDIIGDFHSDALRVVERFTYVSPDVIGYEATMDDPSVFTAPWKIGLTLKRNKEPGFEQWEEACIEGERDSTRMLHDTPSVAGSSTP